MQNTIVLTFSRVHAEHSELLIALLDSVGFDAFEEKEDQLIACIPESNFDEVIVREVLKPLSVNYDKEVSAPRNWNAEWEQQYQPVIIDDFAAIRAHFHEPVKTVQHEIVITPKMSFGTGHHATTRQMMLAMKGIYFTGKKVFDYGTGTGVLAILASMLGAGELDAMDIDDWCIENTTENLERNRIENVVVLKGEQPVQGVRYDVLLANINRHILLEQMSNMSAVLKTEGILLMSGFYEEDMPMLIDAAGQNGLQRTGSTILDKWACLSMKKQ